MTCLWLPLYKSIVACVLHAKISLDWHVFHRSSELSCVFFCFFFITYIYWTKKKSFMMGTKCVFFRLMSPLPLSYCRQYSRSHHWERHCRLKMSISDVTLCSVIYSPGLETHTGIWARILHSDVTEKTPAGATFTWAHTGRDCLDSSWHDYTL